MNAPILLPWVVTTEEERLHAMKWNGQVTRYEFHVSRAIDVLLSHCIEVKSTIEGELPDAELYAPALFNVFPRTMSKTLRQEWKQLETESELIDFTIQEFDALY
jgi:hypothetical protein